LSAPIVWIFIPGVLAIILYFLRRRERLIIAIGLVFSLLLAWLAWLDPISKAINLGPLSIKLTDSLTILGRQFIINSSDTSFLVLIYLGVAFWFGGGIVADTGRLFVSGGLLIASLMTAALAVEPFLFAALLIEMAALVCVPLFSPPGTRVGGGSLRFLVFQTLSMPLILFTGWLLQGAEASPGDSALVLHASLLMAIGFALLLAVFPFHTWMPMVAEASNAYVVAFVFYMLPLIITLFGLGFFDRYAWLRSLPGVYRMVEFAGLSMVVMGGIWTATQRNLARMMAFGMMVEIGVSLLILGAGTGQTVQIPFLGVFFTSLLPRGLGLSLWALSIVVLAKVVTPVGEKRQNPSLDHLNGIAHRAPIAASALILAQLSMAGFPLLAGFPVHFAIWEGLSRQTLVLTLGALVGSAGLIVGGLRALMVFISGSEDYGWRISEGWGERILLLLGILVLLLVGIFPQLLLPAMANMINIFPNLGH
jgi:NADH-quinone oxidoreductase subunit N